MIEVPQVVANKARAAGADQWLADLPDLIAGLAADWDLTLGRVYPDGTEAFVTEAQQADATPAVLKILVPREGDAALREVSVLRLADGEGCARLFESDLDRNAMLMERLGPSLFDLGTPMDQRHEIFCAIAARLWRPTFEDCFTSGAEKGRWLIDRITSLWVELDGPCSEQAAHHAVACAERRIAAHDDERAVLVHGDVHQWNVLAAPEGYKFIDPDGHRAEPEYDLGIVMREDPDDLLAGDPYDRSHERAQKLAGITGLDATAIWEWGVVERASTGLLATKIDLQPVGHEMLAAADAIAIARNR